MAPWPASAITGAIAAVRKYGAGGQVSGRFRRPVQAGPDEVGPAAGGPDLLNDQCAALEAAAADYDMCRLRRELQRDRAADIAGSARYQRCLAGKSCSHRFRRPGRFRHGRLRLRPR
jgi:hypothetical protein